MSDLLPKQRASIAAAPAPSPQFLTRPEAAAYIAQRLPGVKMTAFTLANKAQIGKGPPYRMWGGERGGRGRYALYAIPDLDAWINAQFV